MIGLLALATCLAVSSDEPAPPVWVRSEMATTEARRILSEPKAPVTGTNVGASAGEPTEVVGHVVGSRLRRSPQKIERQQTSNTEYRKVTTLEYECRFAEAYKEASLFARMRPDCMPSQFEDTYIESALLVGDYRAAYEQTMRVIRDDTMYDSVKYVWLSLATAGLGRVYDGQAEFCADKAREWYPSLSGYRFESTHAKNKVLLYSCLALGSKGRPSFYEIALKLDPLNDLAAKELTGFYGANGRYKDLRRVASAAVKRLPDGHARNYYKYQLELAADKPDRPFRLMKFEGNAP